MAIGRRRKFQGKIKRLPKEEEEARDKRLQEFLARHEALPKTIADRAAERRADDRGPNVKCTV